MTLSQMVVGCIIEKCALGGEAPCESAPWLKARLKTLVPPPYNCYGLRELHLKPISALFITIDP